ncbi:metallophosphoesterase [Candidatus Neomarinimicrobiota bacterium]
MAFLIVVLAVLMTLHGYVGIRLIPNLPVDGRTAIFLWLGLGIFTFFPPVPIILRFRGMENGLTDVLSWIAYTSLGFFSLLFAIVLFRDIAWLVMGGATKLLAAINKAPQPVDESRRQFLVHSMNLGLLAATGGLVSYGLFAARREPSISKINIPIDSLPDALVGLKIVQISDLHVGPTIKRDFVERVVAAVNAQNPDLVALTGDLVDGSVDYLQNDISPLIDLKSKYGAYFVTGNHEYYSGVHEWLPRIADLGFETLQNEHRIIEHNGSKILIGGVTDSTAHQIVPEHRSDPAQSIANAPATDFKLLLAHQPNSIFAASKAGYNLQLSGHTHGGQYYPFTYAVRAVHAYSAGLHKHDETWIYVNRGTGYWGPPIRIGVPSEITVLELSKA